ncbi:S-type pyocin domain-containing protein [Pseudomonas nunensis]|uniref:S-type pyocin domain-containing protein n=1 Tax=Pseudomonas nunensis TaxID=2961896 RepID=UPI002109A6BA|nr:S-type pyocin domain-containing protein [Pseudomonas nunensis]
MKRIKSSGDKDVATGRDRTTRAIEHIQKDMNMQKPPPFVLTEAVHTTAIAPPNTSIIRGISSTLPHSGMFGIPTNVVVNSREYTAHSMKTSREFQTRTEQLAQSIEQDLATTRLEAPTHPLPPADAIIRELGIRHTLILRKTDELHQKTALAHHYFGDDPLNKNFHDYFRKARSIDKTINPRGIAMQAWATSYRAAHEAGLLSKSIQMLNQQQIEVHQWLAAVQANDRERIAAEQQAQRAAAERARLAAEAETRRLAAEQARLSEQRRQQALIEAARRQKEEEQIRIREQARLAALAEKQRQDAQLASLAAERARINAEAEAQEIARIAAVKTALAEAESNAEAAEHAFAAEQARLHAEMEQRIEAIQKKLLAEKQSLEIRRKVIDTAIAVAKRQAQLATLKIQQRKENAQDQQRVQPELQAEAELQQGQSQSPQTQRVYPASGAVASTSPIFSLTSTAIRLAPATSFAILTALRTGLLTVTAAGAALISPVLVGFAALLMPSRLGNGERLSMSVPLAELSSASSQTLRELADRQGTLEMPVGLGVRPLGPGAEAFVATADDFHIRSSVPVLNAAYNSLNDVYETALPDSPTDLLTWTPAISPGNSSTESPMVETKSPAYSGGTIVPVEGRLDLHPILVEGWERFIIVFPDDSGIAPLYVVFSSPYEGATVEGEHSGREFNPDQIGGEILNLDWAPLTISQDGISIVRLHASKFLQSDANKVMIDRLDRIASGELVATDTDKRFYTHEIREFERFKALGFGDTEMPDAGSPIWNNVHTATLEDFKLKDDPTLLYTSEALAAAAEQDERDYQNLLKEMWQ